MAALLEVNALKLPAHPIGIAGFYDVYPWLSFAPFNHELGFEQVLRLHVQLCNSEPRTSAHCGWHLPPPGLALADFVGHLTRAGLAASERVTSRSGAAHQQGGRTPIHRTAHAAK